MDDLNISANGFGDDGDFDAAEEEMKKRRQTRHRK